MNSSEKRTNGGLVAMAFSREMTPEGYAKQIEEASEVYSETLDLHNAMDCVHDYELLQCATQFFTAKELAQREAQGKKGLFDQNDLKLENMNSVSFQPTADKLMAFPHLQELDEQLKKLGVGGLDEQGKRISVLDQRFLAERLELIKFVNQKLKKLVPFVDMARTTEEGTVSAALSDIRGMILPQIKTELWETARGASTASISRHTFVVDRLQSREPIGSEPSDENLSRSVVGQLTKQMRKVPMKKLRATKIAWHIEFEGENSIDAGGPYRECIAMMIGELSAEHMRLLIPCANQKTKTGKNQDRFIPNPSMNSSFHQELYMMIGVLLGVCARTSNPQDFSFAPIVYKMLVGEEITVIDLENHDEMFVRCVQAIDDIDGGEITEEEFGQMITEVFEIRNSNGDKCELCKGKRKEGGGEEGGRREEGGCDETILNYSLLYILEQCPMEVKRR
eukprot:TRINITY_DN4307_c3_g1_i1.p1 TRINITY_DN4307_c3_g1~~TRINITY_DN4307_c3_g1_i1.p1  ORF type:complete len:451 (+),score=144.02 TRINITY_DN4307_c3_g1_i1:104-1456(+)